MLNKHRNTIIQTEGGIQDLNNTLNTFYFTFAKFLSLAPRELGVKGLTQGPTDMVVLLKLGLELATFRSHIHRDLTY